MKMYRQHIINLANHPTTKKTCNYLAVASFPLAGLLTMVVVSWVRRGFIEPEGTRWIIPVITEPARYLLTVPLAFLVWLFAAESEHPFQRRFSLLTCLLSLCGFTVSAAFMSDTTKEMSSYYMNTFAVYGVVAGLFTSVSFKECWEYAVANRKRTLIALFAAGISIFYTLSYHELGYDLCRSTGLVVYWILKMLGIAIDVRAANPVVMLYSPYFSLRVYPICNGLEGISIFLFLLSSLIIVDWRLFKKMPLLEIYLIGFIYMFLVNALRIATLFTIGYYAWQPSALSLMRSMRHTPFDVAHSLMGMVYYFIAFGVFELCLYKTVTVSRSAKAAEGVGAKA